MSGAGCFHGHDARGKGGSTVSFYSQNFPEGLPTCFAPTIRLDHSSKRSLDGGHTATKTDHGELTIGSHLPNRPYPRST